MARTLLRLATGDAATRPAFWPWPRWPASFRFFLHVRLVSSPIAADRSRDRMAPECAALLAPQGAQVRVAFLADVQLRLALPRVPASWLQSQIAAHVTTLIE